MAKHRARSVVASVIESATATGCTQVRKLEECGLQDPEKKLIMDYSAPGYNVVFAATGINTGEVHGGVGYSGGGGRTHSVAMSTKPRMVRFMDTIHALEPEAGTQGFQL